MANPTASSHAVHWADQAALRVQSQRPHQAPYVLASGITPSGRVHVGNFREVITVDLVARAMREQGKDVRFIYSWDNFDTFRKVPKNLPDPKAFEPYLHKPIARIPDPWGQEANYAMGRIVLFEEELRRVGISPEYRYQHDEYCQGRYAQQIRQALQGASRIKAILDQHRSEPLDNSWLPTSVYCEACERDDLVDHSYDGDWHLSYHCGACSHKGNIDLRNTKHVKLAWRTDWPMRWAVEQVDFEPGGKDHSSRGGSFDTGKEIVKQIWEREAPVYLQYDFVAIKGGTGKMSSSSGELFSLTDVLEVYEPQMIRWIFASQRPNHDFALAFDEDVIKTYDEFDRAETQALSVPSVAEGGKLALARRTYELSTLDGKVPAQAPYRAPFRELCNRLQIFAGDIERTMDRYYQNELKTDLDRELFHRRGRLAWNWLTQHAPEEFCYSLREVKRAESLTATEQEMVARLRALVEQTDLEGIPAKELNEKIYEQVIHHADLEPKQFFSLVYDLLINRPQGPRLPNFLKEIGKNKVLELLKY